jgi:hypothetical protein
MHIPDARASPHARAHTHHFCTYTEAHRHTRSRFTNKNTLVLTNTHTRTQTHTHTQLKSAPEFSFTDYINYQAAIKAVLRGRKVCCVYTHINVHTQTNNEYLICIYTQGANKAVPSGREEEVCHTYAHARTHKQRICNVYTHMHTNKHTVSCIYIMCATRK